MLINWIIILLTTWIVSGQGSIERPISEELPEYSRDCDKYSSLIGCDIKINFSMDGNTHRFIVFQPNATPSALNMTGVKGPRGYNIFNFNKREAESICARYDGAMLPQITNEEIYRQVYLIGRMGVQEAVFPVGLKVLSVETDPKNPQNQLVNAVWQSGKNQSFNSSQTHEPILEPQKPVGDMFKWLTPAVEQDTFFDCTEPYWFSGGEGIINLNHLILICHRIYDPKELTTTSTSTDGQGSTMGKGAATTETPQPAGVQSSKAKDTTTAITSTRSTANRNIWSPWFIVGAQMKGIFGSFLT